MDIIIYAQALKIDVPGDVYYKNKYIDKNSDEDINMSKFFKEIEILNRSKEENLEKVIAESNKLNYKYLYLEVPCIEKDDEGRYSPIIIQAYYKDVDKIFDALNEFLEKSNRHIAEESKKAIEKEIKIFKKKRIFSFLLYFLFFSLILVSLICFLFK